MTIHTCTCCNWQDAHARKDIADARMWAHVHTPEHGRKVKAGRKG